MALPCQRINLPSGNKAASSWMRRTKTFWPDSDGHTQHSSHCSWPGKNTQSRTSRDRAHNTTSHCCICAGHSQCFCFSESLSGSVGHDGTSPPPNPRKTSPPVQLTSQLNYNTFLVWTTNENKTQRAAERPEPLPAALPVEKPLTAPRLPAGRPKVLWNKTLFRSD